MTSPRTNLALFGAGLTAVLLTATGCSNSATTSPSSPDPSTPGSASVAAPARSPSGTLPSGQASAPSVAPSATTGSYITWEQYQANPAAYSNTHVVLFFNASWCPTCRATVTDLDARKADFPAGLTVVSVDYDSSDELKQEYGVTTQHTFVEIGPDGAEIKKWTGTESVDAINAKV